MEQAEMQAMLSHVFNRLHRLETDMSVLQGKEKDLRTITTAGFLEMRNTFVAIDKRFERLEDQIDTLAIATNTRFDGLEHRIDIIDDRMYILDTRTQDMSLKLNKICEHLAIA